MYKAIWSEFGVLPNDAKLIRVAVFVDEQGFTEEFDQSDKTCYHMVLYDDDMPMATGRIFQEEDDPQTYILGRIAVIKPKRGTNIGFLCMNELERMARELGAKKAILGAQRQAEGFYKKAGYKAFGEEYFEESCPHIHMQKEL